jgi:hypothetical protein
MYVASTVALSLAKPLWFDELFTLYISRVPAWKARLSLAAVDGCPPLFYGLTHASLRLLGENALASRLPEILGFWLMCVCLFLFVRRRCHAIYAFLAMLIPLGSMAYFYAYEARPYGILLGMAGLSLYCWQSIVNGQRRTLALILLAFSIAIAVSSHFYGAQLVIPLFAGEVCRTLERRKIDWAVFGAMVLGLAPLALLLPLTRSVTSATFNFTRHSPVFWSQPHALRFLSFYQFLFAPMLLPLVGGIMIAAIVYLAGNHEPRPEESSAPRFPLHETAAGIGYLLLPAVLLLVARVTTGYFMDRYALVTVVGCSFLPVFLARVVSGGRVIIPCVFIAALLGGSAARTVKASLHPSDPLQDFGVSAALYPKGDTLPIVVADAMLFAQLVQYSPPEVVSRLTYLTDVADAVRRPDFLPELALAGDRSLVAGRVEDYAPFLSRNRQFWLYYHDLPRVEWLPSRLRQEGWTLEYWAQEGNNILFRVSRQDAGQHF